MSNREFMSENFLFKKLWSLEMLSVKKFWLKILIKKSLVFNNVTSKNNLGKKIIGPKRYGQSYFQAQKNWVIKFWLKKTSRLNDLSSFFFAKANFGSKNFGPKKFEFKTVLGL